MLFPLHPATIILRQIMFLGGYIHISVQCVGCVQFATYEAVKRTEKKKHMKDPKVLPLPRGVPIATLAGAAAGFTSTFFVYPFQILADRIILNVGHSGMSTHIYASVFSLKYSTSSY